MLRFLADCLTQPSGRFGKTQVNRGEDTKLHAPRSVGHDGMLVLHLTNKNTECPFPFELQTNKELLVYPAFFGGHTYSKNFLLPGQPGRSSEPRVMDKHESHCVV